MLFNFTLLVHLFCYDSDKYKSVNMCISNLEKSGLMLVTLGATWIGSFQSSCLIISPGLRNCLSLKLRQITSSSPCLTEGDWESKRKLHVLYTDCFEYRSELSFSVLLVTSLREMVLLYPSSNARVRQLNQTGVVQRQIHFHPGPHQCPGQKHTYTYDKSSPVRSIFMSVFSWMWEWKGLTHHIPCSGRMLSEDVVNQYLS